MARDPFTTPSLGRGSDMTIKGFLPSFAAGVIGPGLYGRIDLAKYDVALKRGENVFIHTHGGFSNRAGFKLVAEVEDSTKFHRLLPFQRDDETNLVLVFGDRTMQIAQNGAMVQDGGSTYQRATPFYAEDLPGLDYEQSADVMFFAHRNYAPRKFSRTAPTTWTVEELGFNPTNAAPVISSVTPKNSGSNTYKYVVSSVSPDGVESFPSASESNTSCESLDVEGAHITVSWAAAAGAKEYNVYRARNNVYGFVGFTNTTSFKDENYAPALDVSPVEETTLFNGENKYPGTVAIFQERLVFGGSNNGPENVWLSRVGEYENFTRSRITQASDRISVSLTGRSVNSVRSLLSLRELLAFGARGEFTISGADGFLSAVEPVVTQYGYTGAAFVKPLVINDTALFVERTGNIIRDLRYAFEQDGYSGNELTIMAYHFFKGRRVVDWAYSQSPYSLVWAVLDNGKLLSMTYKREHNVWAWTEHSIENVESIACVSEGGIDAVYIIARRNDKRYILRLDDREFLDVADGFFVDFGITYEGTATSTITGLDHLEGETVVALGDGNVFENLVVTDGAVTLPRMVTKAHVGLSYRAIAETMPPAVNLQGYGTSRGRPHNINRVDIQVEQMRGMKAGASEFSLTEYIQAEGPDLALPIGTDTDFVRVPLHPQWNKDGTVVVVQDYPLPLTVLAIAPEMTIGR